jgi:hypothetical protein
MKRFSKKEKKETAAIFDGLSFSTTPVRAPKRLCQVVPLTHEAYFRLRRVDEELIGTPDYMGIADFWAPGLNHILGKATYRERVAAHDTLLKADLSLRGCGEDYFRIVLPAVLASRSGPPLVF